MQDSFGGLDDYGRDGRLRQLMRLHFDLRLKLASEDRTRRSHVDGLRDCFLFVGDSREPKRNTSALDQSFVSQHSSLVDLPRLRIAAALAEVFSDLNRMSPVFEVDCRGHAERLAVFVFGRELDTVKTRVIVHHAYPSIDADNGLDAAIPRGECVDFAGKRVESILVCDDNE